MLSGSQIVNMAFVKYRFNGKVLLSTTCTVKGAAPPPTMYLSTPENHIHAKTDILC